MNEEILKELAEMRERMAQMEEFISLTYRQKLRLDSALQGLQTFYVATGATGVTKTPLTFKDGILTEKT